MWQWVTVSIKITTWELVWIMFSMSMSYHKGQRQKMLKSVKLHSQTIFSKSSSQQQGQWSRVLKDGMLHDLMGYWINISICKQLALIQVENCMNIHFNVKVTAPKSKVKDALYTLGSGTCITNSFKAIYGHCSHIWYYRLA